MRNQEDVEGKTVVILVMIKNTWNNSKGLKRMEAGHGVT